MRRPLLEPVRCRRVVVLGVDFGRVERLQGSGAGHDADLRGALIGVRPNFINVKSKVSVKSIISVILEVIFIQGEIVFGDSTMLLRRFESSAQFPSVQTELGRR